MQLAGFRTWLGQQPSIKKQSTIDQYVADASRVERCYGDLDDLYAKDRLAGVLEELRYTDADERESAANPSRLCIKGSYKSLGGYRTAVTRYRNYREAGKGIRIRP